MTMMTITNDIAAATQELVIREAAASHLSGIPARQNQAAIDGLYDVLNHLHIARMEANEAAH